MSLRPEGPNLSCGAEYQYVSGQFRGSFASLFARFDALNVQALTSHYWQLDLRYGPHGRQTLDLCPAIGVVRGTAFYFHAGYWHSRECGHSAGAHLAIELALNAPAAWHPQVSAVICISGLFDLVPLVSTSLNQKLVLDYSGAQDCSPLFRVNSSDLPASYFLVGGDETPAFEDQSRAMAQRWASAGNLSRFIAVARQDHFSVLDAIQGPNGLLLALMRERSTAC
jgi:hypothetical protein